MKAQCGFNRSIVIHKAETPQCLEQDLNNSSRKRVMSRQCLLGK